MKTKTGLCAGGPKDGQQMTWDWLIERVMVPIYDRGGFRYEFYVWHPLLKMWIWEGSQSKAVA